MLSPGTGVGASASPSIEQGTQVTRTQQFSWGALAVDTGMGAVFGAAGGAAGGAVAQVAAKVAASTASPAVRAGANAVSCAVNSFVPGTAVLLADGSTVPIEDVELGDEVLATDPETGQTASKPVTALITGAGEKDLTTISIAAQGGDGAGTVVATDGHPFWVPAIGRWVDAGDLLPGDWLSTSAGTLVQVTAVAHDHREQAVHNLTVADTHTYFVAAAGDAVLVHNCGGAGPVLKGQAGVNQVAADIEAAGGKVLGREITVEANGVRTRPDLFVEDVCGNRCFVEVKSGPSARLTKNQSQAFPSIQSQGFKPRGGNAAAAGFTPGMTYGPMPVWTVHIP
ncbi:hypothetical protein GCM10009747_04750 [Agromyces humatus]|uniref:Intein C-terminal splicing domain-containing protein n=1 Tax=Agromyces humatus TaxID=279573 RepID=A0ABN2K8U3_9MICO